MSTTVLLWIVFHVIVVGLLALDLGVFGRRPHKVSLREAGAWSAVWVALAVLFGIGVWMLRGAEDGLDFFTGYVIEKSLGVDNVFVWLMLFGYFAVPAESRPRVLKWGVLGAVVMRAGFILAGAALVERFHWVLYLFGAFLVFTAVRMFLHREEVADPGRSLVLRLARRVLPVAEDGGGDRFFVRRGGRLLVTPLFLVLILVEVSDVVFAVDSIPAVFAITTDPFLVYTSNIFAILGLRAMFFLLAGVMDRFRYLRVGLAGVLGFVGVKMLVVDLVKVPSTVSLAVIGSLLAVSVAASLLRSRIDGRPGRALS